MTVGFALDGSTQAMIDSLEKPEERERLTRFLTVDLQDGKGTGVAYDWFLCVKANRCFMEKQPGLINREIIHPLSEELLRLESILSSVLKSYQDGKAAMERSASLAENAAQRMEKIVSDIGQKVVDGIDTEQLSKAITAAFKKTVVDPLAESNQELTDRLAVQQEVLAQAETTIKVFRRLSLPVMAGTMLVTALLFCGSVSIIIASRIHAAYDRQLAAAVATNGPAFAELSRLHAKVEIVPQGDAQGNPIPGCWALSLDGAEQAQMKSNDPRQRGLIFFRQTE